MKILLGFTEISQKFGPLRMQHGLASISAFLKQNGHTNLDVAFFSEQSELSGWEELLARSQPDVIGLYATAEQLHFIKDLVQRTPEGIFTICGGPHTSCYPQCIEDIPRLDAVCVGEGEYPMLELVTALNEGRDPSGIRNLWVRTNGSIVRNATRPFIEKLDELPFEDRELLSTQESIDKYGLSQLRVMTSRGCPYQCTYCSNARIAAAQSGRYVRFRSAEHIMRELNELNSKYQFEEIFFDDDIFMMNKTVREEFCERYPAEIGKPFVFCGRVECCDLEMLAALKEAGGRRIDFGLEAGSEDLRRRVLKRFMSNEQILEATRTARSVGFQIKTLNMVGLPDETPEKHAETVNLNRQIRPDVASIFVFCPYPGTELHDYCVERGFFDPTKALPDDYVSRRDSLLAMPDFPGKKIARCFRLFGLRVFWRQSPVKAIGLTVLHSRYGEFLLKMTLKFRKALRRIMGGY